MEPEIEAKFIDVDIEDIRSRLEAASAVLEKPMRPMRRALIEEPHHAAEHSFIRIRDEGDRVTLAFKRRTRPGSLSTVDSTHELETTVGDFDTTVLLFKEAGWPYVTYQETRRETWRLDDVEVVIDEWPWIRPYIEIEGKTVEAVQRAAQKLGFDWHEAVFDSVDFIYTRDYPAMSIRGVIDVKEVRFDDPIPVEFQPKKG